MSILIKGVKMPTGNDELRLIIRSNGQVIISHKTYYDETEAILVPPHGRLIDADDFFRCFPELIPYEFAAPTIIPAEEGE